MTANQKSQVFPFGSIALYDFGLCSLPQFAYMRMSVHGGCLTDPQANALTFSSLANVMFSHCYDVDNKLQKDDLYFEGYPHFIYALMESYASRIRQSYQNDPRTGIRLMFDWLFETREIIEDNYRKFPTLYLASDIAAKKDRKKCKSKDTWPVKLKVYIPLYRFFHYRLDGILPVMPEYLVGIIPFNMWIKEYDKLRAEYTGKLGLEPSQRAIVYVNDNKKFFYEALADQCISFCNQMAAEQTSLSSDETFQHCEKEMTKLLHSCFQDYITRLQAISKIETDIDAAIINWMVSLLTDLLVAFDANQGRILDMCGRTPVVSVATMRFYLDICEKIVLEIAHEYFIDTDTIPLVPEDKTQGPEVNSEDLKPIHIKTIDYEALYNAWIDKAFSNISLEDFTYAIDRADFSTMMQKAKDMGAHAGYIGGIKYIMKILRGHLGSNWFSIACKSIDETVNKVNKLNDGTKRIQSINIQIISSCIS